MALSNGVLREPFFFVSFPELTYFFTWFTDVLRDLRVSTDSDGFQHDLVLHGSRGNLPGWGYTGNDGYSVKLRFSLDATRHRCCTTARLHTALLERFSSFLARGTLAV